MKLTEEKAQKLKESEDYKSSCQRYYETLKQKDWIKKTALEEARELTEDLLNRQMMSPSIKVIILDVRNAYEEVISELQDKLKM